MENTEKKGAKIRYSTVVPKIKRTNVFEHSGNATPVHSSSDCDSDSDSSGGISDSGNQLS